MILPLIKDNIEWVKALFDIVLASVTTIIIILTYRQAKETILQPVRSTVIKKQADLLTDLFQFLYSDNLYIPLKYDNIVSANIVIWLSEYGFRFNNHDDLLKQVKKDIVGGIFFSEYVSEELEIVSLFGKRGQPENIGDKKKKMSEEAKKGNVKITQIHLTKDIQSYIDKINRYLKDPFLPKKVESQLIEYRESINTNLTVHLKKVIIKVIKATLKKGSKAPINLSGLMNEFNHVKNDHEKNYRNLNVAIREYLKIDTMP